jgi:hypothetical protein
MGRSSKRNAEDNPFDAYEQQSICEGIDRLAPGIMASRFGGNALKSE